MMNDFPVYELFGLPGSGKTTTADLTARSFDEPVLHGELLRGVERYGSRLRISLRFAPLEYLRLWKMARCMDDPADRARRGKVWQAEKNCLEYRIALKNGSERTVINDQGIVQAVLSICFDGVIKRPERFIRELHPVKRTMK